MQKGIIMAVSEITHLFPNRELYAANYIVHSLAKLEKKILAAVNDVTAVAFIKTSRRHLVINTLLIKYINSFTHIHYQSK